MSPNHAAMYFENGTRLHQAGRLKDAEVCYRAVLMAQPDNVYCLQQFGLLLAQLGRPSEAIAPLEKSCRIKSDLPAFWNNLGEVYRQCGRLVEAQHAFHKAIRINPFMPEAHYNLGNVLKQVGQFPEARTQYEEAVRLKPDYDRAWYNLGNTLREEGRVVTAEAAYRRALELKPDWGDCHLNLANALFDLRRLDEAADEYRTAAALKPDDAGLDDSLGNCLAAAGHVEEARAAYRKANSRRDNWLRELRCETLTEPVMSSRAAIREYREMLPKMLTRFADRGPIDVADLHTSGAEPPMDLAYHGDDDRPIKELYSQFFSERMPMAVPPPPRQGLPRVGVVVTHGHEGVFGRCLGDLVARLDPARLDLHVLCSRSGANVLRHMLPDAKIQYAILPERVDEANRLLREIGYDLLHYWEIGTDSTNYFLPLLRPARVQGTCWGWPATSGHSAVDFFASWNDLEPAGAESHYTESLVRLRHPPTYFVRPPAPVSPRSKEAFGFLSDARLYLCVQNVRKYHPDFDAVLEEILDRDSQGVIAVIADEQPAVSAMLMRRLRATIPQVVDRIRLVPRLEREQYLELISAADVLLDTPHYGGGANTVLDAVAVGKPLVTWAGPFHRGRWAAAVNKRLDVGELISSSLGDYAAIAVSVATNVESQTALSKKIREGGADLFSLDAAVCEWESLLEQRALAGRE